ncbi:flagellin lysine-N-methylase [Alkaliphilus serpentinus]|uniref:Lysine-N-methylase n=1 Tax=Alkaliphilus serpentinus TaxID=1482731 RepID=A0A833HL28_9FIRM|nr:flagellin lysine-N-methylase [Alkaliphilus serpentinus]KAB3524889.1 hypothetical protein F8153_15610 [Alkaliphilus serpentinus]
MEKVFKVLQPKYYTRFQCDPDNCQESCCERWRIIIDKSTYDKYIQSQNGIIKGIVKEGLTMNPTSLDANDYGIINLNKEMICPFLNTNNLCEVYINMGENSLSKTCKTYPRTIVQVGDVVERGLEMSCSVAAKEALINNKPIELESIMDSIDFNNLYVVSSPIKDLKQIEMINEIRRTIINLLQMPKTELSERIISVGGFLEEILKIDFSNPHFEEVLLMIKDVGKQMDVGDFKTIIKNKQQSKNLRQFHHLNTLLAMKFREGDSISFFSKGYIECLMEVLDAFSGKKELEKYYKRSYEKYLRPYLDKNSYILENFMVNTVFVYSRELLNLKDLWTSYLKLCVIYGLVKFNLIGLAAYHKGMNDELLLKLIQSFSKTFIQDKVYWQSVFEYLQEEGLVKLNSLIELITE